MNSHLLSMIDRYVTAFEADVARKQEEWAVVRDEAQRRTAALEKLAKMGIDLSPGAEIVDLNDFLKEDDDEDRGN